MNEKLKIDGINNISKESQKYPNNQSKNKEKKEFLEILKAKLNEEKSESLKKVK